MHTRNLTPFAVGTKPCSRTPPQPEMTVVVKASFSLAPGQPLSPAKDQDKLTAELFRDDDDERRGECLYGGDFAHFKLNAEVLLTGECHAPGGQPLGECPVRFSVGDWSKTLRVSGRRVWSDGLSGAAMSRPIPFTRMPLGWAQSFGGPEHAKNPAGRGHRTPELPCVEDPRALIRARGDAPEPAGFGPINPAWPQRAPKIGKKYDQAWREKRFPWFAEDFDWTWFHAAPPDQQLRGYLRGDEELGFVNLHPEAPSFTVRLPDARVRAFVDDAEGRFREVPMALDTLHAAVDRGVILLTWRGVTPVREGDLADVKTLLVAAERLSDRPLPEDHYRARTKAKKPAPEPGSVEELRARAQKPEERAAEDVTGLDPVSALLKRKLGKFREEDQKRIQAAIVAVKAKAGPDADVDGKLARSLAQAEGQPPLAKPIKPGAKPDVRLRDRMRRVMATVERLKEAAAERGLSLPAEKLKALEELPDHPRLQQIDPEYTRPGPIPTDEPGPGRNLSEQDLSHRDLSGMDLTGANLEGTILTGADLRGAKLIGARLKRAILFKADLSGADLTKADLTQVNAARARAVGADLSGANLEIAFFKDADLSEARLEEAKGGYVVFKRAKLDRIKAARAQLDRSDFSEAALERADLSSASLKGCKLDRARAPGADLSGALLHGAHFESAILAGARFTQARGLKCWLAKADLSDADFTLAVLPQCHFGEATAAGARFYGADLRRCRFRRANLDRAEIVEANLFRADLGKASLARARLNGANLFGASLHGASGAGCDFDGANLKQSTLDR